MFCQEEGSKTYTTLKREYEGKTRTYEFYDLKLISNPVGCSSGGYIKINDNKVTYGRMLLS